MSPLAAAVKESLNNQVPVSIAKDDAYDILKATLDYYNNQNPDAQKKPLSLEQSSLSLLLHLSRNYVRHERTNYEDGLLPHLVHGHKVFSYTKVKKSVNKRIDETYRDEFVRIIRSHREEVVV